MYTLKNFYIKRKIDKATGEWKTENPLTGDGKWDINYSSILSFLINAAGRVCQNFSADLFIDWESIKEKLKDPGYKGEKYLFGFRTLGVDHAPYVLARYNSGEEDEIKELCVLDIEVKNGVMTMTLGEAGIKDKEIADINISKERLAEIATWAIDGLMQDDEESALEYFTDTLELTEEEAKYFGVDFDKLNK